MEGHAEELAGAVDQLLSGLYVDPDKIFALANSEDNIQDPAGKLLLRRCKK
jgi:hypothetical protein